MNCLTQLNFKRILCLLTRQNFTKECEDAINRQINMELQACHNYLAMAFHFNRSDVAAPGVFKFFNKASNEERQHAEMFMEYMNKRGGNIILQGLEAPSAEITTVKSAFLEALRLEKEVNNTLLDAHTIASKNNDPNMCDFIESKFLQEQVDGIKILADLITQIGMAENSLANFLFDTYISDNKDKLN